MAEQNPRIGETDSAAGTEDMDAQPTISQENVTLNRTLVPIRASENVVSSITSMVCVNNVQSGPVVQKDDDAAASSASANGNVLQIHCMNVVAELHKNRFGSGGRGPCIKYNNKWYTPSKFEEECGQTSSKDWEKSIHYGTDSLGSLITAGVLVLHAISCTCAVCCDDESAFGPVCLSMPTKRPAKAEENSPPKIPRIDVGDDIGNKIEDTKEENRVENIKKENEVKETKEEEKGVENIKEENRVEDIKEENGVEDIKEKGDENINKDEDEVDVTEKENEIENLSEEENGDEESDNEDENDEDNIEEESDDEESSYSSFDEELHANEEPESPTHPILLALSPLRARLAAITTSGGAARNYEYMSTQLASLTDEMNQIRRDVAVIMDRLKGKRPDSTQPEVGAGEKKCNN